MLERIQIKNFRALRDVEIDDLARINLIGGRNNAGKTSLLEALFLLSTAGNPRAILNTNLVRNNGSWGDSGDATPWRELFIGLDDRAAIEIAATDKALGVLSLSLEAEWPTNSEVSIASAKDASARDSSALRPSPELALRYCRAGEDVGASRLRLVGEQVKIESTAREPAFGSAILLARASTDHGELAKRLAELTRRRRDHVVLDTLRLVEPRLERIEALPGRDEPMIWCDIGLPEFVPLPLIGEGMINLAEIVLSIEHAASGVVLIDEIDGPFHHSAVPGLWKAIAKAAKDADTQIFATTHSYECFEAAVKSLDGADFRYHRLDLVEGGVRAVTYHPEGAAAAVDLYFEVR